MRLSGILILICFLYGACKQNPHQASAEDFLAGKSVTVMSTAGWVKDDRYVISQPSNVITNNGYSYVFYVKEPVNSPIAGTGYGGTIQYAFSRDKGNTWSDQGLCIGTGMSGQYDAAGVCKPAVIKASDDGFFYLYYVGVGEGFTNSEASSQNKTAIGIAKLIFNDNGIIRVAIKLNSGKPVLEASEAGSGYFDAYRVDDPNPVNFNGQVWLYYTGLDKWGGTPRMGLAVSADINKSHIKQNNNRALLDGNPTLIQKQDIGVMAIFSEAQNAWFASDGLHFNKLKQKFPAVVNYARGNVDTSSLSWGLSLPAAHGEGFNKWQIK
jgi:hypothetical protein